jgi:two-component system cell cycle sensor histidine kinase PleC
VSVDWNAAIEDKLSAESAALRAGFTRERRSIAAYATVFGAVLVGIVAWLIWSEREKTIDAAEAELRSLALANAEITLRTLDGVDSLVRAVADAVPADDLANPALASLLFPMIRDRVAGSKTLRSIGVFDSEGRLIVQSRSHPPPDASIVDRDHFFMLRDGGRSMAIGTPAFSRVTDEWSIFVARRLSKSGGAFGGAVVATIDPAYFETVYASINRRRADGATEFVRDDGVLLVRHLATPLAQAYTAIDPDLREDLKDTREPKVLRGLWGNDKAPRVVAAMSLAPFPAYVAMSEREDTALVDWQQEVVPFAAVTVGALLALALTAALLYRQVTARETAHRAAEHQARQQTALLREILDNMPIGVSVVDAELRVFAFNQLFLDLLELRGMKLGPGDTLESVFRYNAERGEYGPGDIATLVEERLALARNPRPHQFERRRPGGQALDIRGRPLRDGTMVTTYIDVTARARSEAELRAAKDAAEIANRAKSAFLASMSHELRTPLNAIIGFTEFIAKGSFGPIAPRYSEYAGDVLIAARHLLSVINDILDMSKIEAGRYDLKVGRVRLDRAIAGALAIARGVASERTIAVHADVAANLPEIVADERAVKQVLLNLLSNAVKFTSAGGSISVSLRMLANDDQEIVIADTGRGIAPDTLHELFRPFARGDVTLSRPGEGTGLGLWISLELVTMHGGTLRLESVPNVGTKAIIVLPPAPKTDDPVIRLANP